MLHPAYAQSSSVGYRIKHGRNHTQSSKGKTTDDNPAVRHPLTLHKCAKARMSIGFAIIDHQGYQLT
eukprot:177475-Pelagomonas_calceolata.AAC.6